MIKTLTNIEKTPITGKDDFDERLEQLLDDKWEIIHFNTFGDYERKETPPYTQMTTTHITKIAVLQK